MAKNTRRKNQRTSKNMRRDREIIDTAKREEIADKRQFKDCRERGDNDPSWYAQSPQLIKDYASLPFGNPLGTHITSDALTSSSATTSIPGIFTLHFTPTIGVVNGENDAVNVAMRNIYAYVRHANSGSSNYEGPDLMMYLLAMDSCYMFHAWLKRLYGQLMLYTPLNRYYPQALIESEGVEFASLQDNIADFRGYINQYAIKLGAMCVPNSMSYMARHTWMCSNLYVDDGSTPKAQTYKYVPASFWQFGVSSTTSIGQLTQTTPFISANGSVNTKMMTINDLIELGNSLINPIIANEDMNIMSGDILKAFGTDGVVKISGIDEGYIVLPVYSQEVLSQIENADVFNGFVSATISQDTTIGGGYLKSNPIVKLHPIVGMSSVTEGTPTKATNRLAFLAYQGNRLFNMHHQDVTPEEVVVASRLKVNVNSQTNLTGSQAAGFIEYQNDIVSCGSEIVCAAYMWQYQYNNLVPTLQHYPFATAMICIGQSVNSVANYFCRLSAFDWNPFTYFSYYNQISADGLYGPYCFMGDVSNYTTINDANVRNMNDLALLSEFSIPMAGLYKG